MAHAVAGVRGGARRGRDRRQPVRDVEQPVVDGAAHVRREQRRVDEGGHADAALPGGVLAAPERPVRAAAHLAGDRAVVRREDDQSVVVGARRLQRVDDAADGAVHGQRDGRERRALRVGLRKERGRERLDVGLVGLQRPVDGVEGDVEEERMVRGLGLDQIHGAVREDVRRVHSVVVAPLAAEAGEVRDGRPANLARGQGRRAGVAGTGEVVVVDLVGRVVDHGAVEAQEAVEAARLGQALRGRVPDVPLADGVAPVGAGERLGEERVLQGQPPGALGVQDAVVRARRRGVLAAQQRRAARRAVGLRVVSRKLDARVGEGVDHGRRHPVREGRVAVVADVVEAHVVGEEEDDVRRFRARLAVPGRRGGGVGGAGGGRGRPRVGRGVVAVVEGSQARRLGIEERVVACGAPRAVERDEGEGREGEGAEGGGPARARRGVGLGAVEESHFWLTSLAVRCVKKRPGRDGDGHL